MKAVVLRGPGKIAIEDRPEPTLSEGHVLLKVNMVGLCGSDLNSYRGKNPMVSFPRIPGHEISATVVEGAAGFKLAIRSRFRHTLAAANAQPAGADAQTPARITRRSACSATVA